MSPDLLVQLTRDALLLVVTVVAAPVLAAMAAGLLVGVGQAVTQIQDQALSLAFRVVAVFGALAVAGPWAFEQVSRFASRVLAAAGGA